MGKTAPRRGKLVGKREPKRAVKKAILKEDKPPSGAKKKDARTRLERRDSDPATTEGGRMDAKGWTVVSLATQDDAKGWTDGRERMFGGDGPKYISLDQKPSWFNNGAKFGTYGREGETAPSVKENFAQSRERYTILTVVPSDMKLDVRGSSRTRWR
jgi:hypothetical protein